MIDFIRLLDDNGIDHKPIVKGWENFFCPYHENGKRGYKAGFNLSGNYVYCWSCGWHPLENIVSELLNISFYEAKKLLQEYETETRIIQKVNKKAKGKEIVLPGHSIEKDSKAWNYLVKRNFDPQYLIDTYKIQDGGLTGYWAFRIIIPIILNNIIISYQGRSFFNKDRCSELDILRYITLDIEKSIINPKTVFYNMDNSKNKNVIIVEGAFDCWRFGNNCIATLGTNTTSEQINLAVKTYDNIFIIFDPEEEAQQRAKELGNKLSALGVNTVEVVNTELNHDPGDMNKKEVDYIKKELKIE